MHDSWPHGRDTLGAAQPHALGWPANVDCSCLHRDSRFYTAAAGDLNLKQPSAHCPAGNLAPTDSYVIPSWGGVVIYNPPNPAAGAQPPDRPATSVLSSAQLSSAHAA